MVNARPRLFGGPRKSAIKYIRKLYQSFFILYKLFERNCKQFNLTDYILLCWHSFRQEHKNRKKRVVLLLHRIRPIMNYIDHIFRLFVKTCFYESGSCNVALFVGSPRNNIRI